LGRHDKIADVIIAANPISLCLLVYLSQVNLQTVMTLHI